MAGVQEEHIYETMVPASNLAVVVLLSFQVEGCYRAIRVLIAYCIFFTAYEMPLHSYCTPGSLFFIFT